MAGEPRTYDFYLKQYSEKHDTISELQRVMLQEHLDSLTDELELNAWGVARVEEYIHDPVNTFRTLRRCQFDLDRAIQMLKDNIVWRVDTDIDHLSLPDIEPQYIQSGLFYFHGVDKYLRPSAVLNLKHVERTEDNSIDELKRYILFMWEIGRKWTCDLTKQDESHPRIQFSLIVNLDGAGMANMELELVPFLLDILKSRYPGTCGVIYVLNYGWMYAGMWQVAKRMLPPQALHRIKFVSKSDLLEYFEPDQLLVEHGGDDTWTYSADKCPVLQKFGKPTRSIPNSQAPSRTTSMESIADVFYSAPATPWASRPSTPLGDRSVPSWLSMTSGGSNSGPLSPYPTQGLHRINSLRSFKLSLPGGSPSYDAEDSSDSDETVHTASLPPHPPTPYDDRRLAYHRSLMRTLSSDKRDFTKEVIEDSTALTEDSTALIKDPTAVVELAPGTTQPPPPSNVPERKPRRRYSSIDPQGGRKARKRDVAKFITHQSILVLVGLHRQLKRQVDLIFSKAYGSDIAITNTRGWSLLAWLVTIIVVRGPVGASLYGRLSRRIKGQEQK